MNTEQQPVPYEIYVGATNELFQLRALNAELLAALGLICDRSLDEQAVLIAGRAIAKAEQTL